MNDKIWLERVRYTNELIDLRYAALDRFDNPQEKTMPEMKGTVNDGQSQELQEENIRLHAELQKIYNSRGWRLLSFLYRLKDKVIPPSSFQYKLARKMFHGLRFIKRSLRNLNRRNLRKFWESLLQGGPVYAFKKAAKYNRDYPNGLTDFNITPDGAYKQSLAEAANSIVSARSLPKQELVFRCENDPLVSIIIPVYNQWDYTYNCLKSILSTSADCSYEIIIADDGSTDDTERLSELIKNVNHIRNPKNLGFLRNCNNAAEWARGKYILFLNNDTCVLDGWLSSLIDIMERDSSVGMAGSKLIYPDGTLQEAGGIVWNDGTGLNYGRGRDPEHAEYNYVKEVDYISGASIMIRKSLWLDIGGFDERYIPAYFEDSDLAFEIRKRGYKVVYQPKSALIHFERTSYGDTDTNTFRLMEQNRPKFMEKWADTLQKDSLPHVFENIYIQRDRCKNKKTILFIDDYVPMFDRHAGGKTTFNFLQLLLDLGFKITFIGDNEYSPDQPYTEVLQQMGIEVIYGPWYRANHFDWMGKHLRYFDYVFLNRPHIGKKYARWFKENSKAVVVYYGHDLHFLREYRQYEKTGDIQMLHQSQRSKEIEMEIMKIVDIVLSVSPEEKKIIDKELNNDKTIVTPIFFYRDFEKATYDISKKSGLVFVGGFAHTPNVDGVKWFVSDILPIIRKEIPDIKLTLAGSNPTAEIMSMAGNGIEVTGYLSDEKLTELYQRSRVCVIPLRFGAGVKGKTVDAMYNRMAIVSTSIGLEGLNGIESYLQAHDDPDDFAREVIRLYKDDNEIAKAYEKNIEYVRENLSYKQALDLFESIFGRGERN